MMRKLVSLAAVLALAGGLAACRVRVDKDASGQEKNVQVDTPFGGVHVNTDQTSAADIGLPVYPGAAAVANDDKHKSVDVHVGFGEWQMRVQAMSFETADSREQVAGFYKKALGRYGDVLTCEGNAPVGMPRATSDGLTCSDDGKHSNVKIDQGDYGVGKGNLELKAGSKRHQHIVGFETPKNGKTRFALVSLELPADSKDDSGKSD
ncbi:MAG: hypothetical protein WCE75_11570 [Terracidiphilus sp.]